MQQYYAGAAATAQSIKKFLGSCEWYEFAAHEKPLETAFFATGSQLKV